MKNIAIQFATIILLCPYLHFPSQAQNIDPEMESDREDIEVTSEEEEEKEPTRSYIGLGGTIGISGDATPLGEGGFSLIGRSAFTDKFSLHTSSLFQDDGLSLFSLTLGFPIGNSSSERELLFPFAGAGIAIEDLFGDFGVDALITTGVDIPIGKKFVGTARVNITFPENDTDIGLLLGIGYNFSISDLF
ncbi:conserved exported hypothetical protein [Hyella patelloides LEGE 07179]|uniref:Outer membrane protein beta-barrel domain-containing protein n=1 Tax=Hyella patelloides LEGE 07179 TaxID=945734 RepID=A0A563VRK9_9CYAN|nr:hypothetical protein [Hyella patelloides]VEP14094.1 conserved exported hypothetical protein [Hyella patelloides LEGE 07179]